MENSDLDMIELSASEAARAVDVSYRTMVQWLETGIVKGRQTITLRRYTTVGALRDFLPSRGPAGEAALAGLEEYVIRNILPKRQKGEAEISTDVLSLAQA